MRKIIASGVGLFVALVAALSWSATVPLLTGPVDVAALQATLNQLIQNVNANVQPLPPAMPRNFVDNGAMQIQQRGTGTATCANNGSAIGTTNYAADRWGCEVNVSSGAGQLTPITVSPAPPVGFSSSQKLVKNSGALAQTQCAYQEIPSFRATQLAGQNVVLSGFLQALAGLAADNANQAALVLITGTGTDQGFGSWTASPAITPAWTGVATLQNQSYTITTGWVRYSNPVVTVPTTVTEIAVAICFTPTTATGGATDGLAFTGIQLEPVGANVTTASPFEFKAIGVELLEAQRYFQILTEPAASVLVPVQGSSLSATVANMSYGFPVVMRSAPTFTALGTALSGSTWKNNCGNVANALATTFIVTNTANTVSGASLTVTSSGSTIGFGCTLVGAGGGSILSWSSDF